MTKAPSKTTATARKATTVRKLASGTKQDHILGMLRSKTGATIAAIIKVTGWQPHTARGFLSLVAKRLGLRIESDKAPGKDRVYRIVAGKPARRARAAKGK